VERHERQRNPHQQEHRQRHPDQLQQGLAQRSYVLIHPRVVHVKDSIHLFYVLQEITLNECLPVALSVILV
jgi:hypothetical protein